MHKLVPASQKNHQSRSPPLVRSSGWMTNEKVNEDDGGGTEIIEEEEEEEIET